MQRKMISFSGVGEKTFGDIEHHAVMNGSGVGAITINGTIGEHAKIEISGVGEVRINGLVEENVTFIISGARDLIFAKEPPASVINSIQMTGAGKIQMPGMKSATPEPTDRGGVHVSVSNNGGRTRTKVTLSGVIDGNVTVVGGNLIRGGSATVRSRHNNRSNVVISTGDLVINNDTSISSDIDWDKADPGFIQSYFDSMKPIHSPAAPTFFAPPAVRPEQADDAKKLSGEKEERDLSVYSKHLREYILGFQKESNLAAEIVGLKLTEEEQKAFAEFIDPISLDYMTIPVSLNERFYDLKTVAGLKIDPYTREEFSPLEVQSARNLVQKMKEAIAQVKANRQADLSIDPQVRRGYRM